ncbi:hypothetical protein Tco_0757944 [Tanacetum coccineum]
MHAPLKYHFDMALKVLKHPKLALCLGVEFIKKKSMFDVVAYSDSDWAKCPITRKSVFRYYVSVNGNLVSWKIKKQATLSKSSAEAEYRAMASVTYEVMWIVKILKDFNIDILIPASLFCDNKEKIASGLIKTIKVESKYHVVDILTKAFAVFVALVILQGLKCNISLYKEKMSARVSLSQLNISPTSLSFSYQVSSLVLVLIFDHLDQDSLVV